MVPWRSVRAPLIVAFANRRVTSFSCPDGFRPGGYFDLFPQSSMNHGHQLLGLPCVTPFLITLTFIVSSFLLVYGSRSVI